MLPKTGDPPCENWSQGPRQNSNRQKQLNTAGKLTTVVKSMNSIDQVSFLLTALAEELSVENCHQHSIVVTHEEVCSLPTSLKDGDEDCDYRERIC